jgi:hypothetical protein
VELLFFTFLGLLPAQYGFYVCISLSNAAMAPILQYTAPAMIVLWFAFRQRRFPEGREILGVFLAMLGVFLVSTHGRLDQLVVSPLALFWGLFSGVGLAIYTVAPVRILKKFSTTEIMGWGQILSGLFLACFFNPFHSGSVWDASSHRGHDVHRHRRHGDSFFHVPDRGDGGGTYQGLAHQLRGTLEQHCADGAGAGDAAQVFGPGGDELHHHHGFVIINTKEVAAVLYAQQSQNAVCAAALGCFRTYFASQNQGASRRLA